jgi:hypothetical protein
MYEIVLTGKIPRVDINITVFTYLQLFRFKLLSVRILIVSQYIPAKQRDYKNLII